MKKKAHPHHSQSPIIRDQHFMTDSTALATIVSLAKIGPNDMVLEIGAGTGALTELLAKKAQKTVAIEIDTSLGTALKKKFRKQKNIQIIIGNALKVMDTADFDILVSNTPYAIAEPLFTKLLTCSFKRAVLTLPKKFAYTLAPGTAVKHSQRSLLCSVFFSAERAHELPKTAFHPPPKTNSVVLILIPAPHSFTKSVFSMRTSKTKNALREALCAHKKMTKNQARETIKSLNLNKTVLETRIDRLDFAQSEHLLRLLKGIR